MKKVLYLALVIVLLVVSGFLIFISTLDSKVKDAVEENAAHLTGSPVTVESVDFSVLSGKGAITGLRVSNPEGFSPNPALTLGKILFEIDMGALSMDTITVKEIKADSTRILVEKNREGKINFQVLSENLKKVSGENDPAGNTAGSWVPNLRITEFLLSEGSVTLAGFAENSRDIKTPEIRLRNLGGASGSSPEEIGEEILSRIFSEIIRNTVQSGLQKWIEKNTAIPDALKDLINKGLGSINLQEWLRVTGCRPQVYGAIAGSIQGV